MFTRAIVRTPCPNMPQGLTTTNLGLPDYSRALIQHQKYVAALELCGLQVTVLEPDNDYPDSTFVEDTALLLPEAAVITPSGAASRKGETVKMEQVLKGFYDRIEHILPPGSLDSGDILKAGRHYYIGLSQRTNKPGADQLAVILGKYGYTASTVSFDKVLHLKTGTAYLENNNLVVAGEFINKSEFQNYNLITVADDESPAANCIWVNGSVIAPAGYLKLTKKIENLGYRVLPVELSEFQKLDGGASCLSLRF